MHLKHQITSLDSQETLCSYQSIASSKPSPLIADVLNIDHDLLFKADNPNAFETSVADIEPSMSCKQ